VIKISQNNIIGKIYLKESELNYLIELNDEIKNSLYVIVFFINIRNDTVYNNLEILISKNFLEKCLYYLNQIRETWFTKELKSKLQFEVNELLRTNMW